MADEDLVQISSTGVVTGLIAYLQTFSPYVKDMLQGDWTALFSNNQLQHEWNETAMQLMDLIVTMSPCLFP